MATYTQGQRPLQAVTPLGKDALLLVSFWGEESISNLFCFCLELLADKNQPLAFDKLLGRPCTVSLEMAGGKKRYFSGIANSVSQAEQDDDFTTCHVEIVPQFWLLTRRVQSRIFQQIGVPDILKKVLQGLDVDFRIQGEFQPRDYCVQYGETDFDFASRLMEEEGIFYYFTHSDSAHKMVVTNSPQGLSDVPGDKNAIYEGMVGGPRPEDRVYTWRKTQQLRSGKVSFRDHCFELTGQNLAAEAVTLDSVQIGKVSHKLKVGNNGSLELYDYPGQYAQRFDGVDPGGGDRASDLQKIFKDNDRTARIRMQEETVQGVDIRGQSNCRQFTSGHRFQLNRHFDADAQYLLTSVRHQGRNADYRSNENNAFDYDNQFTCIPTELPFRPLRKTEKPVICGTQTAVVVGPAGEEIFTDKYGRVKVQFPWDREGKHDGGSSCWIRVASNWAGKKWGGFAIPRIGHEVVVAFEEGDPDRPIIVGNVYNDQNPPPVDMPAKRMISGLRSATYPGSAGYNMMTMDDTKGKELIQVHGQYDMDSTIEHDLREHILNNRSRDVANNETILIGNNQTESVGKDETIKIGHNRTETVENDEQITIGNNRTESVGKDEQITIGNNRTESVGNNEEITIGKNRTETVGSNEQITIGGSRSESVGKDEQISIAGSRTESVGKDESVQVSGGRSQSVGKSDALMVGKDLSITAADSITIVTGAASIVMKKDGTILIQGKDITVEGSGKINGKAGGNITLKGQKILQN